MTSMPARSFRTVNAKGNVNTSIFGIRDHFEQPLQAKVLRSVQNGLAMLINPKVHGLEVRNTSLTWNYRFVTMDD